MVLKARERDRRKLHESYWSSNKKNKKPQLFNVGQDTEDTEGLIATDIGTDFDFGIFLYEFTSFFSHSCCPNTQSKRVDNKLAIVVSHPIKKGEQLLTSYG